MRDSLEVTCGVGVSVREASDGGALVLPPPLTHPRAQEVRERDAPGGCGGEKRRGTHLRDLGVSPGLSLTQEAPPDRRGGQRW